MNRKWILAGALAFGFAGVVAAPTMSYAKEPAAARREYDEEVRYNELPKEVQRTVDKERGKHEVKSFQHVMRDGREFYRAVIDTKGDDKVIRIKPAGELLTEQEARDVSDREVVTKEIGRLAKSGKIHEVVKYNHRGHPVYRAEVGEGKYLRYIRVAEGGKMESVRGDIDPGEVIPFDRCPGQVKQKIGALAKSGRVDEVIEYKRGGHTYYQAEVDEKGGDRSYFYTVDESGREVEGLPRV
jgi:hypothetical protein